MAQAHTSIHEMLKDTPTMNESNTAIHSGTEPRLKHPNSLPLNNISAPETPTNPLTSPLGDSSFIKIGAAKIDTLKNWSISTYKCTRQIMLEKLGKSSRTIDSELEAQIEQLRDTQRKYLQILRLTRALSSHFHHVVQTNRMLSEAFSDLAQKSPELQEEFTYNSDTQKSLTRNGELLLNALNFFTSSINTLCNKTIEDTLITIRQYETARIEYDAYRMDLENSKPEPTSPTISAESQKSFDKHKENYEKLRADITVKMQFLDENRIKVMHKQLVLLHNAVAAYFKDEHKKVQKNWDLPRIKSKFNEMFASSEPTARARLLASSTKESSKWLQVVPSSQLGLLLDNNSARIAVGLRLGCQLFEEHICVCGVLVKKDGLHGLSCPKSAAERLAKHHAFNNITSHGFSSAGFPTILEPPGISRDDGKRPDGMTLIPWSRGRSILWDVTIRDTLAPSYINESSKKACAIADKAERFKHNHYIALKENHLFTPIAFETLGCMGPETKKFIDKLGFLMKKATGESRSKEYLLQRYSIAMQRGNAACILKTLGKNRIDDFYLL